MEWITGICYNMDEPQLFFKSTSDEYSKNILATISNTIILETERTKTIKFSLMRIKLLLCTQNHANHNIWDSIGNWHLQCISDNSQLWDSRKDQINVVFGVQQEIYVLEYFYSPWG